ncbi:SsgA family sporulation/cell division regulator [Streptomyces mirabilis]|uniref:SsgA family sporulation/cell division regulator n=1 Tax=Streptomyces mirabilis TaxID=68239 RepID=A0ABU3V5A6_9ACTN|nr:SsgA family sporulation/cell division regulator [Streptomyces mirabilis]MCX5355642.1 SsgA family sporulation/cell division regulator [Streptomyces mirabilis]MDU9001288.1 SsgA family sporulation/cell division regulator [Streptomyces mirabilis]
MDQQWALHHQQQLTLLTTLHNLAAPPESATVVCRFGYAPDTAYSVRLDLVTSPGDQVTWVIGRDLLLAGTEELSGDGDVKIWPSRQRGNAASLYLRLQLSPTLEPDATPLRRLRSRAAGGALQPDQVVGSTVKGAMTSAYFVESRS